MSKSLNHETSMNDHDAMIFDSFINNQRLEEIQCATDADLLRVAELCRRAFLKGMQHESLLSE